MVFTCWKLHLLVTVNVHFTFYGVYLLKITFIGYTVNAHYILDDVYLLFITFIYIWYRISDAGVYCCRLHNGDINSQVVFSDNSTVDVELRKVQNQCM